MQDLIALFTTSPTAEIAWSVIFAALAAGSISPVLVMHRMAFLSEAMAHSILLGVPLAVLFSLSDVSAMLAVAFLVGAGIMLLRSNTRLSIDSILGVLMAGALALAIIMVQREHVTRDLDSYLFGDIAFLPKSWLVPIIIVAGCVFFFSLLSYNRLAMTALARDLVRARGQRAALFDAMLMIVVAIVITAGVRVMGVLMVTALLVIPAAAARNICRSLAGLFWASIMIAALAAAAGFIACNASEDPPGPTIVVVLVCFFLLCAGVGRLRAR